MNNKKYIQNLYNLRKKDLKELSNLFRIKIQNRMVSMKGIQVEQIINTDFFIVFHIL